MSPQTDVENTLKILELDKIHKKIASNNRKLKRVEDKLDRVLSGLENIEQGAEMSDWEDKDTPF